jgi:predicted HicB family RNase H-like nuclease
MKPIPDSLNYFPIEITAVPAEDGGGYSACIPALGRLAFEATGETIDAAITSLRRVSEILLEEFRVRKQELPDPPLSPNDFSGRLLLRMPKHVHRRLDEEAHRSSVSLNTYIVSVLSDSFRSPHVFRVLSELCGQISSANQSLKAMSSYEPEWKVTYFNQQRVSV